MIYSKMGKVVTLPSLKANRLSRVQQWKFVLIICICFTVLCSVKLSAGYIAATNWHLPGLEYPLRKTGTPKIVLARVLGNSLPPLHSINQTTLNLETILKEERLPPEFARMWVVNCVINPRERNEIISLLEYYNQVYIEIPLSDSTSVRKLRDQVLNVNKARNTAIRKSFSIFDAEWVFSWDGSQFMTRESAEATVNMVKNQEGYSLFFTPMYRLIHNIPINSSWTFEQIYPHVKGLQEPLIAISRNFYYQQLKGEKSFFDEEKQYGNEDKLSKLRGLMNTSHTIGCKQALRGNGYGNPKRGMWKESELVSQCGFALRLLYKPAPNAAFNQEHTLWNDARGNIRGKTKRLLLETLKAYVESKHHVIDQWADEYAVIHDRVLQMEIERAQERALEQQKLEDAREAKLRELRENFKQFVKWKQNQKAKPRK